MHITNSDLVINLIIIYFNKDLIIIKRIKPKVYISVHVLISVEMLSNTVQIFHNAIEHNILDYPLSILHQW